MVVSKRELLKQENIELYAISKALADIGYFVLSTSKALGTNRMSIEVTGFIPDHQISMDALKAELEAV